MVRVYAVPEWEAVPSREELAVQQRGHGLDLPEKGRRGVSGGACRCTVRRGGRVGCSHRRGWGPDRLKDASFHGVLGRTRATEALFCSCST